MCLAREWSLKARCQEVLFGFGAPRLGVALVRSQGIMYSRP